MNHVEKLADSIMRRIEDEKAIHRDSLIDEINGAIAKANQPSPVYVLAADARERAKAELNKPTHLANMSVLQLARKLLAEKRQRANSIDPLGGM